MVGKKQGESETSASFYIISIFSTSSRTIFKNFCLFMKLHSDFGVKKGIENSAGALVRAKKHQKIQICRKRRKLYGNQEVFAAIDCCCTEYFLPFAMKRFRTGQNQVLRKEKTKISNFLNAKTFCRHK
jgi:hypothetical protein